jgi:hypothetical protein
MGRHSCARATTKHLNIVEDFMKML